jgi:putative endonuclease
MSDAWVYILRCADGSLYTGWTVDVERRLASHAAGAGARYTRSRLPVELLACFAMADAGAARREEARIKRLTRPEKLALVGAIFSNSSTAPGDVRHTIRATQIARTSSQ